MESFFQFWQHIPEKISPVLFSIGSFQIRYYSIMYLAAFLLTYVLVIRRIKTEDFSYSSETIQNYLFWAIAGLILGARLGYVLFYHPLYYFHHPLEILSPFSFDNGIHFVGITGMSYHGGAIGVAAVSVLFCRKNGIDIWNFADLFCPAIPLGYTFGRIGNFLNGELYGRPTSVPWGMYFPLDQMNLLRHPSQLYEAVFEGIFLFTVLWLIRRWRPFSGIHLALYIMGYGVVRFFIEFYREPDAHIGLVLGIFSLGQILCLLMILTGLGIFFIRRASGVMVETVPERRKT
ncbi:MAG TPA: prolipoprotein diacylglyceryl transferase [Syntrophales bacterium]|nr:prolipoprotein diacylglyceryl transferase [Syntrophales bacterium]HPL64379.1 prolipoprotein diacylglyceryl transferase [Syntrophales bacterium]